jgi:hypothetical protein
MQNKLVLKLLAVAAPITVVCGLLALLASATPQSASQPTAFHSTSQKLPPPPRCSLKTIAGEYAYTIEARCLPFPTLRQSLRFRFAEFPWPIMTAKGIKPSWTMSS